MFRVKNKKQIYRLSLSAYGNIRLAHIYDAEHISDFDDDNYSPHKNEHAVASARITYTASMGVGREDVNCREGR